MRFAVPFLALLLVPFGHAAAVTIGHPGVEGSSSSLPFGFPGVVTRYQQIYAADAFDGPIVIRQIAFLREVAAATDNDQPDHPAALVFGTFELRLSTSARPVDGLDLTDLGQNVGGDDAFFATLVLDGGPPPPDALTVRGAPFSYDPAQGNLLLEVLIGDVDTQPGDDFDTAFFDAQRGESPVLSIAFSPISETAQLAIDLRGDHRVGSGLVTEFSSVPEPGSAVLLGAGIGALLALRTHRQRPSS